MEFQHAFTVQAPLEDVWSALLDVERVAPCMPGAQVLGRAGEDAWAIAVAVKVGPIAMRYRGELEVVERDAAERRAVMRARAREARGQGTAAATIETRLTREGDATAGTIHTDLQLSGRAAAMGRGVIQDVATRLVQRFSDNLAAMLASEPEAAGAATAPAAEPAALRPDEARPTPSGPEPPRPEAARPPPPRPEPEPLAAGELARGVLADRLRDPRAVGAALLLGLLLGWLTGRARGR